MFDFFLIFDFLEKIFIPLFELLQFFCIASDAKLCFASVELFLLMVIMLFYVLIIFHISEILHCFRQFYESYSAITSHVFRCH